jgi:plastocyanin
MGDDLRMTSVSTRARRAAVILLVAPLALGACSSDDEEGSDPPAGDDGGSDSSAEETTTTGEIVNNAGTIDIADYSYSPDTLEVKVGEAVTFANGGAIPHTVTSEGGGFENSDSIQPGDSFVAAFSEPGTYSYFCAIHGADRMEGTITVVE